MRPKSQQASSEGLCFNICLVIKSMMRSVTVVQQTLVDNRWPWNVLEQEIIGPGVCVPIVADTAIGPRN